MDHTNKAMDHLDTAMAELRWSKSASSAEQRQWAISNANAAVMRAQGEMDKIMSDILEDEAANR